MERWAGLTLVVNVTPDSAQKTSAECRHRLATSLFRHAEEMAELGEDIGIMDASQLTAREASSLEMKRRKRVSLLDASNAASLTALDPSYTPPFLANLSLPEASCLEMKRRSGCPC